MNSSLNKYAMEYAQTCLAYNLSLKEAKALFERTYVELTLEKLNGHKLVTAKALGISRKRLWELLRSWNAITVAAAVVLGAGAGWVAGIAGTIAASWF